jgi:hypothetical protein
VWSVANCVGRQRVVLGHANLPDQSTGITGNPAKYTVLMAHVFPLFSTCGSAATSSAKMQSSKSLCVQ